LIGGFWKNISLEAINLIKKLMTYNPNHRISATDALQDPWIVNNSKKFDSTASSTEFVSCVENLKSFKANSSFQKAILSYLAGHVISKDEEKRLRDIFTMLDKNGDGQLSEQEIIEGYKALCGGNEEVALEEAKKIMENIDINKNGSIDYNGT